MQNLLEIGTNGFTPLDKATLHGLLDKHGAAILQLPNDIFLHVYRANASLWRKNDLHSAEVITPEIYYTSRVPPSSATTLESNPSADALGTELIRAAAKEFGHSRLKRFTDGLMKMLLVNDRRTLFDINTDQVHALIERAILATPDRNAGGAAWNKKPALAAAMPGA